ncbi:MULTISPECIES: hypothetical protein [Kamptonema]|uniref:hypothetical protein n=1 Tax=Kamptonema TaxID=1501433 RepID=UPI0001DAD3A8|nr:MULTISPECIES: hypothetical protein [Kamptonema]CBN57747.1 conserved hypothetical protein [Kamptonema sp. PCC 6506]
MTAQREELYMNLIDKLLHCPNGKEPEVLDSHQDLIDAGLIQAMAKVAAYFAHHDNPDASKFLIHVARELSKQLGLYTEPNQVAPTENI